MKTFITALGCALLAPTVWSGEQPILPLKLPEPREPVVRPAEKTASGGIVYARIDAAGTQIEAIYDLGDRAQAVEKIYFPVFAPRGAATADVLERTKFYAHLGAVQLEDIAVARAPANAPTPPTGARIVWFQFVLKDPDSAKSGDGEQNVFKVSYWQPHVNGHFYFLPQHLPARKPGDGMRAWQHPIIVRSLLRLADAPAGEIDHERMGDLLVVFPKDASLIAIPVVKTPASGQRSGTTPPAAAKSEARRP